MRIYFSGIGGVGIGPLAEIARGAGYDVLGSDANSSLTTSELAGLGIAVSYDQSGANLLAQHNLASIDWFVYTSSLPEDHPELLRARSLGIHTSKRDELLNFIINQKNLKLIAIAGTHGKTTTTAMMVWTMQQLGIPVSYSIGSGISFGPSGKFDPNSEYFVYECDEFDRNFLHFNPFLSLITSIDFDHADTYPTTTDYTDAFSQFMTQSNHVIAWKHDLNNDSVAAVNSWQLADQDTFELKLAGAHNRHNASLVIKACQYLNLGDTPSVTAILENFPGSDRRFERLAPNLYTDYGHHPVEIAATLQMAREISDQVVLVYQPHQNTRQHQVRSQYTNCMELAETIYWLPTYTSREDETLAILKPEELASGLTNANAVKFADLNESLWRDIEQLRLNGKLVLCMGAGSIDGWLRSQIDKSTSF